MKSKIYNNVSDIAKDLGLKREVGFVATIKAKLTLEIIKVIKQENLTHKEVAEISGVARTTITGIVNASLQKVSIDRLVRVITSLGREVDINIKTAA